jgi:hypothetical protein
MFEPGAQAYTKQPTGARQPAQAQTIGLAPDSPSSTPVSREEGESLTRYEDKNSER